MDNNGKILIVDDKPENLKVLGTMLEHEGYEVLVANNGSDALEIAKSSSGPDLILLDIMMNGMDGFEVCKRLKGNPELIKIPVIFITALVTPEQKIRGFREGAVDYITKPFHVEELAARVNTHIQLKKHRDNLQLMVDQQTKKFILAKEATIASMAIMAEFRDPETGGHIQRTKKYVRVLAQELINFFPGTTFLENIELLVQSVPLHDIGKIGIPDAILYKEGKLTETEFEEMKKHTIYVSSQNFMVEAKKIYFLTNYS